LITVAAVPLCAGDIQFDPATTQAEFQKFARIAGQAIFATPVQPARTSGILGFDIGVAATAVKVDTGASYWQRAVKGSNLTRGGYLAVPRLVVAKGFSAGTISASYAKVNNSTAKTWGGAIDVPIIRGGVAAPEIALRTSYATLTGVEFLKLKTYGAEVFISKGFGPFTPYAAFGRQRVDARGTFPPKASPIALPDLRDRSSVKRLTAGFRISMFIPKIVVEATQAEVRSYAAKVSVGF
jgi:hypothetical protein